MRTLIVEADDALREAIALDAEGWAFGSSEDLGVVSTAGSVTEGVDLLQHDPELLLVDVRIDGGGGIDLLRTARARPLAPSCLAMSGHASADEAFELARLGVRGYLAKPFTLGELRELVNEAVNTAPAIESLATAQVGHVPILTVQDQVKKAMLQQALARSEGNYVKTARALGVTRQAVQQMVRRYDLER